MSCSITASSPLPNEQLEKASNVMIMDVELIRPSVNVSWGMTLKGGREFSAPIYILKLEALGLAQRAGLEVNDELVQIGEEHPINSTVSQKTAIGLLTKGVTQVRIKVKRRTSRPQNQQQLNKGADLPAKSLPLQTSTPAWKLTTNSDISRQSENNVNVSNTRSKTSTDGTFSLSYPLPSTISSSSSNETANLPTSQDVIKQSRGKLNLSHGIVPIPVSLYNQLEEQHHQSSGGKEIVSNPIKQASQSTSITKCCVCLDEISGPYVLFNQKHFCTAHFVCNKCGRKLGEDNLEYIETRDNELFCIEDYEKHVAPKCLKCSKAVLKHQVVALDGTFHPECFTCHHCHGKISQLDFRIYPKSTSPPSSPPPSSSAARKLSFDEAKREFEKYFLLCEADYLQFYAVKCSRCNKAIEEDDEYVQKDWDEKSDAEHDDLIYFHKKCV